MSELTRTRLADLTPRHFLWKVENRIATIRLDRPDRKNPLTFESYAELRDTFRALAYATDVDVVIFASNGGNFCSGGDVHDIIGPLVGMDMKDLLAFTRMTGDLVKAMIGCGKPIIAAVEGIAVGAGAIIAMASDLRLATPDAKCAFLFTRVGLAGCDMGACAMLPRIIGQGRAAELLYTGRVMGAEEGAAWGFWNALHDAGTLEAEALKLARRIADGPVFAHGITKTQLNQEWNMGLEQAIEAEAQAQATLARITPTEDLAAFAGADLIIEAVFEDRAVKGDILGRAQAMLGAGGFIASNTSTLAISGLATAVADPARFIGLHFFSPVERMPLVEVIVGAETSAETIADALAFVARLKKTPIVVHDSPGFYTSRVFCTYIDEAMAMLAEGISPALIENAARMAGFPAPPLSVTDEVSLDLQARVIGQAKADRLDARFLRAHAEPVVARFNTLGRLGRKTGGGFYDYAADGGKQLWPGLAELFPQAADQPTAEAVGKRLLYIQALESARCLAEGVIDDEATGDIGSVLGIGYPAWTGGALSLISTIGPERFAAECAGLAQSCGARFSPDDVVIAGAVAAASRARAA